MLHRPNQVQKSLNLSKKGQNLQIWIENKASWNMYLSRQKPENIKFFFPLKGLHSGGLPLFDTALFTGLQPLLSCRICGGRKDSLHAKVISEIWVLD